MPQPDANSSDGPSAEEIQRRLRELDELETATAGHGDDPRLQIPDALRDSNTPTTPRRMEPRAGETLAGIGQAWSIALEFVFTVVAGGGLGWLFDRWKGASPTGTLVGLSIGFVLAFYRIIRTTQAQEREEMRRRAESASKK